MKNRFVRYTTGWHYAPYYLFWLTFGAFRAYRGFQHALKGTLPVKAPRSVQERFNPGQRAALKRRAYIHRLNRGSR